MLRLLQVLREVKVNGRIAKDSGEYTGEQRDPLPLRGCKQEALLRRGTRAIIEKELTIKLHKQPWNCREVFLTLPVTNHSTPLCLLICFRPISFMNNYTQNVYKDVGKCLYPEKESNRRNKTNTLYFSPTIQLWSFESQICSHPERLRKSKAARVGYTLKNIQQKCKGHRQKAFTSHT